MKMKPAPSFRPLQQLLQPVAGQVQLCPVVSRRWVDQRSQFLAHPHQGLKQNSIRWRDLSILDFLP
jgi:hypothetical protein